jgi:acetoin utilization deacetylase AcuC-like enzyme
VSIDDDTHASSGTQAAAVRAAGLVVAAVDDIYEKNVVRFPEPSTRPRRAFVMARPPGHHAEAEGAQGFCFFNNVLVGVAHAQAAHGVGKVGNPRL